MRILDGDDDNLCNYIDDTGIVIGDDHDDRPYTIRMDSDGEVMQYYREEQVEYKRH